MDPLFGPMLLGMRSRRRIAVRISPSDAGPGPRRVPAERFRPVSACSPDKGPPRTSRRSQSRSMRESRGPPLFVDTDPAAKVSAFGRTMSEFSAKSPAPARVVSSGFPDVGADQHPSRDTGGRCADPVQSSPTRSQGSTINRSRRRRHMELNFPPCAFALLHPHQAAGFDDTVHIATRVADNPH
jgi:hypothetical protein